MSLVLIRAALETALNAMPGIIPAADIVASNGNVFTTSTPHGLVPGINVTVSNHVGDQAINGTFEVSKADVNTFSLVDNVTGLPVSSNGTGGSVLANLIAWENIYFPTTSRVPYLKTWLMPARPEDITMGAGYRRENGILQVNCTYPIQQGPGDAMVRAELIKSTFSRGSSFSSGGIVVNVNRTPEIMTAGITNEDYVLPVRVPYWANIFS